MRLYCKGGFMLHIGCHLSSSKGYVAMGKEALSIGADTFAFFTRNPRGGAAKPLDEDDVAAFNTLAAENHFAPLVAHAPYTLNPCAAKPELRTYAFDVMLDDLRRLSKTPGNCYNFHPGSHVQQGEEKGIELTADLLARVMAEAYALHTTVLVETMAGKGSEIGKSFSQVQEILSRAQEQYERLVESKPDALPFSDIVGVCLDTCHVWDGGYDIASRLEDVISEFDRTVGLCRLHAVHLNDSMNPLGAHKDRHEKIGRGHIGLDALSAVTNHASLRNLPFILETPYDAADQHEGYRTEIALMRSLFRQ